MSSDGYFDDEEFDESALRQLDAIEAAHFSPRKAAAPAKPPVQVPPKPAAAPRPNPVINVLDDEDSYFDSSFNLDAADLAKLDTFIEDTYQGKAKPVMQPARASSSNKLQTTLFGDVLQPTASSSNSKPRSQAEKPKPTPRNPFGQQAQKTKEWDHTQFAKTGVRKSKSAKGKGKARADDDEDGEEEDIEFEQFPAPFVSLGPPPPMKVEADLLEAKHWIFPINRPKRDYQFNIVKNSLFENTLVALPTGLGKTFIAGVVMLNYYRWFPEGKVVFVAPTKPLVAQQVTACHETCGIPGGDSIEMTGEVAASTRARYWANKRVFFMTPQTLVNDLMKENCDARDIVLLVVDEAHRATGDYAYNQVIRFLMAKNPHFRVLALTATPGNNPEAVQLLVDGLHISRIEIRDEQSVDLRAYIHKKVFKAHIITANEGLAKVRDLLVKVMDPHMKKMYSAGVFHPGETAVKLHPYRAQASMQRLPNKGLFGSLSILGKLARAMLYLLTGSFTACYIFLNEISNDGEDAEGGGSKKNTTSKKLKEDPNFRALMTEFEIQRANGFSVHPKVEKLKTILIQHFGSKLPEDDGTAEDTKVMVFSNYRGVVDEITDELNKERPLIRATRFIGQGTDKQGKKGLAQKEQNDIIRRFKAGEFNVLVCTSIGEEGLDIGEIDMTVCYDADKAPTRMIQRFGRTGRAREGVIHALLFEGREENNIEKAEATYKEVQNVVNKGINYELYGDVKRLIPDHIKPQCVEKVVEIQHYVRDEPKKKDSIKTTGSKRKRNDEVTRNIPTGASTGFVSVRDLVVKGAKKPKKAATLPADIDQPIVSDDDDRDIMDGDIFALREGTARPVEEKEKKSAKPKPKPRLKKAATTAADGDQPKKAKAKKAKKVEEKTLSQVLAQESDSDDAAIEGGFEGILSRIGGKSVSKRTSPGPSRPVKQTTGFTSAKAIMELSDEDQDVEEEQLIPWSSSPKRQPTKRTCVVTDSEGEEPQPRAGPSSLKQQVERSILELSDSDEEERVDKQAAKPSAYHSPRPPPIADADDLREKQKKWDEQDQNMGWLIDDDDDDDDDDEGRSFQIVDSSPIAPKKAKPLERVVTEGESFEISKPVYDDDDEVVPTSDPLEEPVLPAPPHFTQSSVSKGKRKAVTIESPRSDAAQLGICSPSRKVNAAGRASKSMPSSPTSLPSSSPLYPKVDVVRTRTAMLPPALPRRLLSSPEDSYDGPEPSYPIRQVGPQAKRRRVVFEEMDSPSIEFPPQSQRRLRRAETTPVRKKPASEKTRREKPTLLGPNVNIVFDGEAAHSGDEESEGYSEEEEETEEDRRFIKDSPATQAPESYDQSMVYRKSLLTQGQTQGLAFANRPVRARPFGRVVPKNQNRYLPSSSPPPPDEELDSYEVGGSFVVADDAEISYEL